MYIKNYNIIYRVFMFNKFNNYHCIINFLNINFYINICVMIKVDMAII